MIEPVFYTTEQLAVLLQRHPKTLQIAWRKKGNAYGIVPVKIGSRICWPRQRADEVISGGSAA